MTGAYSKRLRTLSYIVIIYMIFAFIWWAFLLFNKNQTVFDLQFQLLELQENSAEIKSSARRTLQNKYQRQVWMIYGEAGVFILSLVAGLWFIHKAYIREVKTIQQASNFLLAITHELKSPLASIRLILDTFAKHRLPAEKIQQLTKSGLEETERLHTMVNNLLLSAKLSSVYRPYLEELNVIDFFNSIIERNKKRNPNTIISFNYSDVINPKIQADKSGLETVLDNLLDNAMKYAPLQPIQIKGYNQNDFFCFEVTDLGMGIPKEEFEKIFERFYRIGSEETRKSKGSGLGLFIVKKVTEAHNGRITVDSTVGQGSTFKICLPSHSNQVVK